MRSSSAAIAIDIEISPPRDGWSKFLFGTVGQVLYLISDEKWEEIKKDAAVPCNVIGCDCHIMHPKVLEGLEVLRKDAKKAYATGIDRLTARSMKS